MDADNPALQSLSGSTVDHDIVRTERARSVEESAGFQGIDVHRLVRSIVVRRAEEDYVFVLVPGGRAIDWPKLRKHLGVSRLSLPDADEAKDVTGYERGAITPFGSLGSWPVIADASIEKEGKIAIGGGAHGVNIHISLDDLILLTEADVADVTKPG